jgi:hypothetical protein
VGVLGRKGIRTKQYLYKKTFIEFRRKNPCASILETAFLEPYLLTETENKIIDDILGFLKSTT